MWLFLLFSFQTKKVPTEGPAPLSDARTVVFHLSLGGASIRSTGTGSIRPDGPP